LYNWRCPYNLRCPSHLKIRTLLELIDPLGEVGADLDPEAILSGASSDSRTAEPGDLFIALPGARSQGVDHLDAAFEAGCLAALAPDDAPIEQRHRGRCIAAGKIRRNAALVSAVLAGEPTSHLLTLGVTGTNGKTSSCYILRHILEACGHRVVMLSTIAQGFGDWQQQTLNTTPDAPLLQKLLAAAVKEGATAAVIEVSAHGVLWDRILGCRFDGLLFTNLSPDHLDAFDGMEAYFAAKQRLFVEAEYHKPGCRAAIGLADDYGERLLDHCPLPSIGFGWSNPGESSVSAAGLRADGKGIRGELFIDNHKINVDLPLTSEFNCLNITGAAVLSSLVGLDLDGITRGLSSPLTVPGRLMEVPARVHPFRVIIDFAHTEVAMANLLSGLRRECQERLIVVFGAGGDRDHGRRPGLTKAVFECADVGIITLDNPRSEPPEEIIDSMRATWQSLAAENDDPAVLHVESDRARAIEWAIGEARAGDIVVLAGKGHETTQIFADRVEPHDDFAVASEILGRSLPD